MNEGTQETIRFSAHAALIICIGAINDPEAGQEGKARVKKAVSSLVKQLRETGKPRLAMKLKGLPVAMAKKGTTVGHKLTAEAVCEALGNRQVIATLLHTTETIH